MTNRNEPRTSGGHDTKPPRGCQPTEGEEIARRSLSRASALRLEVPGCPVPYVRLKSPSGAPGFEVGVKFTF